MPRLSKIGAAALAAFGWTSGANAVTASYLVVAGGGGSGYNEGGGGGAGGYQTGTTSLDLTLSYTVVVGAGGNGDTNNGSGNISNATNGNNSQFGTLTASVGGGFGGSNLTGTGRNGANGGSGGGVFSNGTAGTGTSGQGNAGGTASTGDFTGGGGGAGAVGGNGNSSSTGAGGNGTASSISGTSTYYAGGGSGGGYTSGPAIGAAGLGGGGLGVATGSPNAGTANTGGGAGGGAGSGSTRQGANGGSGVVIISYPSPQKFGGGIVTTSGSNTIHTFQTSGTLSPLSSLTANFLVVAGGGGGGRNGGGGGGAGGYRTSAGTSGGGASAESALILDTNSIYTVTVGAGGANSVSGSNSVFNAITSTGGGRGGSNTGAGDANGASGGSGGGGQGVGLTGTGGAGTTGQGFAGGLYAASGSGGGGGASAVGADAVVSTGGNGGAGVSSTITGSSVSRAGGGGGSGVTIGNGGAGGGGNAGPVSASAPTVGANGSDNTGGGGGGGGVLSVPPYTEYNGGAGGSGVVVISYAGATQLMAGGTVTITGGNVIHTFTSSGYLTPLKLVNNSLRFRSSATASLNRTASTPTNNLKWTWSAWVKKGELSTFGALFAAGSDANNYATLYQYNNNTLFFYQVSGGGAVGQISTTAVYRDPAAWYHIVVVYDSANATSANRLLIYVNGVLQTTTVTTALGSSQASFINSAIPQYIGRNGGGANNYFDGYQTEVNFIDGQSLTPNSFGTFNSYGVWQPITYGGSYGNNGFYLPFNPNALSYAGSFNGSSQYLYLGGQSNFAFGTGDFTIEFYLNASTFSNSPVIYDARPVSVNGAYSTIYFSTNGEVLYFVDSALRITSSKAVSVNTWTHIAVVRSGTTTTLYLNGVARGTYSDTTNYLVGASRPVIGISHTATNFLNGSLSNLRVVKGTAVYTANFTPSTTPLTAITNTQLLTLQNATIIDNSTNAFTINNIGTVTTGQTYPLAISIFNDQSPAGNNWTGNNISGASGSTLDYMTDVPTLTSATAANYCVLNPLDYDSSTFTLSNANLTFSGARTATGSYYVRSTIAVTSDKWYWEVIPTNVGAGPNLVVGIQSLPSALTGGGSLTLNGYAYGSDGLKWNNGGTASYGATWTNGDVIGIAYDATAGTITFYKNNTSQGTAFTGITAGTYTPIIEMSTGGVARTVAGSINFGQQPFVYTPPANYLALNTFNL